MMKRKIRVTIYTFIFFILVCTACRDSKEENILETQSGSEENPSDVMVSQNDVETNDSSTGQFQWRWVVEPGEYEELYFDDNDFMEVKNSEGKMAVINMSGEIVIPFDYDSVLECCDGIFKVTQNGDVFYIDRDGNRISKEVFQDAYSFREGMGAIQVQNLWGFMDAYGNVVIECQYDEVKSFSTGLAAVRQGQKWGYIDKTGQTIVEAQYDEARDFKEGMAAVRIGDKWGFIDSTGNVTAEVKYDEVKDFQEGYAAIMSKQKWGYINEEGKVCIALNYDDAGNFSEGKAAVMTSDGIEEWAYINEKGEIVIDFYPYDAGEAGMIWIGEFHDGIAFVSKSLYCIIDEEGNDIFSGDSLFFISQLSYDAEYDIIPGYVYIDDAMKVRKYGLMDIHGNQRLEPIFDYVGAMNGKYVMVSNLINGEYQDGVIELVEAPME